MRSQRDLFSTFLDRPAGMPELMSGQTRSTSVSKRREQSVSDEASVMLNTLVTEHLLRFVYEGATETDPDAGAEDALITTDGVLLSELMEIKSEPEDEQEATSGTLRDRASSSRPSSKTRKRLMSVVMRRQVTKKGVKGQGCCYTPDRESD